MPKVTVTNADGTVLSESCYEIEKPFGCTKVGRYRINVRLTNGYEGLINNSFTIKPRGTAVKSVKAGTKSMTVSWKTKRSEAGGYKIQYASNKDFTKNVKTVTVKGSDNTSKTIKKLTSKKKYYVRVRTYKTVGGTTFSSGWSGIKAVTVK